MKQLNLLLIVLTMMFSSCNHNNEPPMEIVLPIADSYVPCNKIFDLTDTDFLETAKEWNYKCYIINSKNDLPDDPFGFNESYTKINFNDYSLLLTYRLHKWTIDTYSNRYVRNNVENSYNWLLYIGASDFDNEDYDVATLTRFAIKVRKLPADANLVIEWGYRDHGFDWTNRE